MTGNDTVFPEVLNKLGQATLELSDQFKEVRRLGIHVEESSTIIAYGSSSAGKSAVLQAISRIPFPRACPDEPRHLTEVIFCRSSSTKFAAAICFGAETQNVAAEITGIADFAEVYREASALLANKAAASLIITMHGPTLPNLRLVDVPGLPTFDPEHVGQVPRPTDNISKRFFELVQSGNSIVLAVVDANETPSYPPLKQLGKTIANRTLGILTKADVLLPSSQQLSFCISFARNEVPDQGFRVGFGWHILSNGIQTETDEARDAREEGLFASPEWSYVPKANKGAAELRSKLNNILAGLMRQRIFAMSATIRQKHNNHRLQLQKIGDQLPANEHGRKTLKELTKRFHDTTMAACAGAYSDKFFSITGGNPISQTQDGRKLRHKFDQLNAAFGLVMTQKGARWIVEQPTYVSAPPATEGNIQQFAERFKASGPDPISSEHLREKISSRMLDTLSFPLGYSGTENIIFELFCEQRQKWRDIAEEYIDLALAMAKTFLRHAVGYIVGTYRSLAERIEKEFAEPFLKMSRTDMIDMLTSLMQPYQDRNLARLANYRDMLMASSNRNLSSQLVGLVNARHGAVNSLDAVYTIIAEAGWSLSDRAQWGAAFEVMSSYYKVAVRCLKIFLIYQIR